MGLIDRVRDTALRRRLAPSTVSRYQSWIADFLRFCRDNHGGWRHPRDLAAPEVQAYLTHLARDRRVSASTQNQAMCAIVFLYRQVLADELPAGHLGRFEAERSTRPARVPTVLSAAEVARVLDAMEPGSLRRLMVRVLYGTGMRLNECCTLRVRDVDFDRGQILICGGKGDKDRLVMLPACCRAGLAGQVRRVRHRHGQDVAGGGGYAPVPDAVANKCSYAARDWWWQFVFPSAVMRRDAAGRGVRWHADGSALERAIGRAARGAGVSKRVTAHAFRHSFATHLLEAGYDIRQVRTLLGHASLKTTMIYTHVMNRPATAVTSPLDRLAAAAAAPAVAVPHSGHRSGPARRS
jgi:integron integrase